MKPQDLRKLTDEEIAAKIRELKEELFRLRFQQAMGQLDKPHRLKEVKKDIARAKTILRERELGLKR
ncbi:50S ribosomal protein L29 [Brockia lithotrophica]|nr:50S ribosomal protein L29 [Brockia lithotrophica]MBE3550188.1 50S ribosomal protein L29 [Brockia lithotrophica]MBT9253555.1 50S ribosomal protein L29 [Brockia lithotrophica]RKQ85562.1 LSU ribosomal protein L29P [Brockia lithotrophica]